MGGSFYFGSALITYLKAKLKMALGVRLSRSINGIGSIALTNPNKSDKTKEGGNDRCNCWLKGPDLFILVISTRSAPPISPSCVEHGSAKTHLAIKSDFDQFSGPLSW